VGAACLPDKLYKMIVVQSFEIVDLIFEHFEYVLFLCKSSAPLDSLSLFWRVSSCDFDIIEFLTA
jgi:hypothetical protein